MNPNEDFLRTESRGIVFDVLDFGKKYIKHKTFFSIIFPFIKPKMDNIIMTDASIQDIRSVLFMVKKRIDKLSKMIDIVEEIKSNPSDASLNKKIEQMPGFKKLLEMFD
jgi:hypothetical protein